MHSFFILLSKIFKKTASFFEGLGQTKASHDDGVKAASSRHHMAHHPDESYYAQQYLYWIRQALVNNLKEAVVLDLGCGQGRLTVPLGGDCQQATGVDFTPEAIEAAKAYAQQKDCGKVDFVVADVLEYAKGQPKECYDIVVCTEITFFLPVYKEVLKEIYRILKPKGMAFISFRSQFFNILHSIQRQKWDSAQMAIDAREGYLWGGATWFGWQSTQDIKKLLNQTGFDHIECIGIGVTSGIEGDPMAFIARPSLLTTDGQKKLGDIEIQLAKQYADQGRYILAIVRK